MQEQHALVFPRSPLDFEPAWPGGASARFLGPAPVADTANTATRLPQSSRQNALRRILVPTDFSPSSAKALARALEIAGLSEARITLLHVIDINAQHAAGEAGPADGLMDRLWAEGKDGVAAAAVQVPVDRRGLTEVAEGLPWEEIVMRSEGCDLLVMGKPQVRHGWRPFARHTVQRVVAQARCPVLVVPESEGPQAA